MSNSPTTYAQYQAVRAQTLAIAHKFSEEDLVPQSMPDASPGKWHLGHTTWFFETFILDAFLPGYSRFDAQFAHIFNSYYVGMGSRHARPERGLLTRPALSEVLAYREATDKSIGVLLKDADEPLWNKVAPLMRLGMHHEMQHQELMLTDLKHLLSRNPAGPKILENSGVRSFCPLSEMTMRSFEGGRAVIGAKADVEFCYDNETPAHPEIIPPFALANRPVSNAEWCEFIEDGGYENPLLWLSDGWATAEQQAWKMPLYWERRDDRWWRFGLDGWQELEASAPAAHISFYEADAYARWRGKRLPRENEWEFAAAQYPVEGHFLESGRWQPEAVADPNALQSLYGSVWEWTQSAYSPYPGFQPAAGAVGEYNGKFMANQFVLRGGSCATPRGQIRSSYRNFFYPFQRWQFSGLRLAEDLS